MAAKWIFAGLMLISPLLGAQEVHMGFGLRIPPYAFADSDRGIEIDIAREALAYRGHQLVPHYFPFDRLPLAFRYGRIDASMMDIGEDLSQEGGHYAEPAVFYDNVLVSLERKHLELEAPEQLEDLVVMGFSGAGQRYAAWVERVERDGLYFESNNQEQQVLGLFRDHFDVLLTDRYIFNYFAHKVARERGLAVPEVTEHHFTKVNLNDHRPVFRDPAIRDDFNAGLRALKESGRFDAIYQAYLNGEMPSVRQALPIPPLTAQH